MNADPSGWMLITESGAAASPYDENVAETPGTGVCTRSDGATGTLAALVPDGWLLVDVGIELIGPAERRDRVYVVRHPGAVCWLEAARPSRRWRSMGSALLLFEADQQQR